MDHKYTSPLEIKGFRAYLVDDKKRVDNPSEYFAAYKDMELATNVLKLDSER